MFFIDLNPRALVPYIACACDVTITYTTIDPKQYRQSPRLSLSVFSLNDLNTAEGVV